MVAAAAQPFWQGNTTTSGGSLVNVPNYTLSTTTGGTATYYNAAATAGTTT